MSLAQYESLASRLNELNLKKSYGFVVFNEEKEELSEGNDELLKIARLHISQMGLNAPQNRDVNLWAVHPSCCEIDNGHRPKQIDRFLEHIGVSGDYARRILMSDSIDYVLKDHQYVREGLFDSVILTSINEGIPLDLAELEPFRNAHKNQVGGNYIGRCVDVFSEVLEENGFESVSIKKKWAYDINKLSLAEIVYKHVYHLLPTHLRSKIEMPRELKRDIFVPRGTFG